MKSIVMHRLRCQFKVKGSAIAVLIVFVFVLSARAVQCGSVPENIFANIILGETLITVQSDNFLPHYYNSYGGSEEFVVISGIIRPDTMVAFYWSNPYAAINEWRCFYLDVPLEAGFTMGRYRPSSVTVSDSTVYVAVSKTVLVYRLGRTAQFTRMIDLPVDARHLDIRGDTLYFASDHWSWDHVRLPGSSSSGYYGCVPLNEDDPTVEYWPIEEPLGLVMGLFQPRSFIALRGPLVAWVKGLGDSLVIESRGARITSYSLKDNINNQITDKLQAYVTDTTWTKQPQLAMDYMRTFYKNYDLIRKVEFVSDSTVVIDVVQGVKYDSGILKGKNISKLYFFRFNDGTIALSEVGLSVNPRTDDKPSLSAPLSQHKTIRTDYIIAIQPINVRVMDAPSYNDLVQANEEATQVSRYSLSIQLRNLK